MPIWLTLTSVLDFYHHIWQCETTKYRTTWEIFFVLINTSISMSLAQIDKKFDPFFWIFNVSWKIWFPTIQLRLKSELQPNFILTQFVSNHGKFGEYLSRFGLNNSDCSFCSLSMQSSLHLLLECPAFHLERFRFMIDANIDSTNVRQQVIDFFDSRLIVIYRKSGVAWTSFFGQKPIDLQTLWSSCPRNIVSRGLLAFEKSWKIVKLQLRNDWRYPMF